MEEEKDEFMKVEKRGDVTVDEEKEEEGKESSDEEVGRE